MKNLKESGFLIYVLFLLGIAALTKIPTTIFEGDKTTLCGIIALCVGFAVLALSSNAKEYTLKKTLPITYALIWAFLGYAVAGMFMIGFCEIDYESIISLAKATIIYVVYPLASFIIEGTIINKKEENQQ